MSDCPLVEPGTIGRMPKVRVFLRDPNPYLREIQRKTTENYALLGRQARQEIVPGTSL